MLGDNDSQSKNDPLGDAADPSTQPQTPNIDDLLPPSFPDENSSTPLATPSSGDGPAAPPATNPPPVDSDLAAIKQQALQELTPLVGNLEQTPEEKFKTTMMMIQAGDNSDLIKTAYDAAQQITDNKEKAQALLDIVNEINYFTQQPPE